MKYLQRTSVFSEKFRFLQEARVIREKNPFQWSNRFDVHASELPASIPQKQATVPTHEVSMTINDLLERMKQRKEKVN